jgi:hypothetical protein
VSLRHLLRLLLMLLLQLLCVGLRFLLMFRILLLLELLPFLGLLCNQLVLLLLVVPVSLRIP